jgi:hypothetical protein
MAAEPKPSLQLAQHRPTVEMTSEFRRWSNSLDDERCKKVEGAIDYVVNRGPTLGRPQVDVIHGSRLHKLKEVRVDRGTRLLFAFDSTVMSSCWSAATSRESGIAGIHRR